MRIKIILSIIFALLGYNASAQQTTTIDCPNCNGNGSKQCVTCNGAGRVMSVGFYGPQWFTCGFCKGAGTIICYLCGGSGKYTFTNSDPSNNGNNNGGTSTNNGSNNGGSSTSGQNSKTKHWCNICKGTGSMIKEWYVSSNYEKYCNICKKTFYCGHSHTTCTSCNGTGYW